MQRNERHNTDLTARTHKACILVHCRPSKCHKLEALLKFKASLALRSPVGLRSKESSNIDEDT
eukprot:2245138-Amphidinium_carterae.2